MNDPDMRYKEDKIDQMREDYAMEKGKKEFITKELVGWLDEMGRLSDTDKDTEIAQEIKRRLKEDFDEGYKHGVTLSKGRKDD